MNFNAESARRFFECGGFLIFRDAPANMEFGIDNHLWTIGSKFMGVKMIPPGLHLISFTLADISRQAFFHVFKEKEIYVVKWNSHTEELDVSENYDPEALERYRANIYTLDPHLGAYPLDAIKYTRWKKMTSFISEKVVTRILPSETHAFTAMSESSYPDEFANVEEVESVLEFTRFDIRRSYPDNSTAQDITKYSLDKSWLLLTLIKTRYGGNFNLLLGELQFSFIVLIYGHNFEGFEQWKRLFHVITHSGDALSQPELQDLFLGFLQITRDQLEEVSADMFDEVLKNDNFIRNSLVNMTISTLCELDNFVPHVQKIHDAFLQFQEFILSHLHWNLPELAMEEMYKDP